MSYLLKGRYEIIAFLLLILCLTGCSISEGGADDPMADADPAHMYDGITSMGQMVQANGYSYDPDNLDESFTETMACLRYSDIPSDIFIILKEPYSAFPCVPLPNGCGGLFDLDNGEPVITVTADLVRLKHEYIHYMLYYSTGDSDSNHVTDNFDRCA